MPPYAIDPELVPIAVSLPRPDVSDIPALRQQAEAVMAAAPPPDPVGVDIRDARVAGSIDNPDLRVRIYEPQRQEAPAAILDIHGGGFVTGRVEWTDKRNLWFARELGIVVVAVDYRLAPEHPYPAALEDCFAALSWVQTSAADLGIEPGRVALHGTSAGGGLAAALSLLVRDRGGPPIAFQYLAIPALDDRLATQSMTEFVNTPVWDRSCAEATWRAYLGSLRPGSAEVPSYAAPARETNLAGLPPTYISAMQFDPLRDEGIAYALALLAARVPVELHVFPGTFHSSSTFPSTISDRDNAEALAVLRRGLSIDRPRA